MGDDLPEARSTEPAETPAAGASSCALPGRDAATPSKLLAIYLKDDLATRLRELSRAPMEERDDKETVRVDFHPPAEDDGGGRLGQPVYAVAPTPHDHERAQVASPEIAAPDLHTVTIGRLLEAIEHSLDTSTADNADKQQAQRWITCAREGLSEAGGHKTQIASAGAARALAEATTRTLGLAQEQRGFETPSR